VEAPDTVRQNRGRVRQKKSAISCHLSNITLSYISVAKLTITPTEKSALRDLLDDPSPAVRQALKHRFTELGSAAADFLRDTAQGNNRHLMWHARQYLEELNLDDPTADFRKFILSLNYELETGSLMLARTIRPDLDMAACCEALEQIANRCRDLIIEPSSIRTKCRVINRILFHEMGFRGNSENYTDPDNSFIDQVLERRRGIPISMCTLYLLIAQRLGLELEPIGLPGHFMIGCFTEERPFFIDAFDGGVFRSPEEIFVFLRSHEISPQLSDLAPTPVREVLSRSCRNLANHYESHGQRKRSALFDSFVQDFDSVLAKNMS
jgi:regulator of sirC expression with transglutaminase-like and TPR domain